MNQGMADTVEPLPQRYRGVREFSEVLCEPLAAEDCVIQSMPDVSPTVWHLAHTTWFFETFVLAPVSGYRPVCSEFAYLFNSYYNGIGEQFPRSRRGVLSRPTLAEVFDYRRQVDAQMQSLLETDFLTQRAEVLPIIELGLQHEQQHQELMLTDIKHVFSCNPLLPVYREQFEESAGRQASAIPLEWQSYEEGVRWIGHEGEGFAFDNELPRHRVFVERFELANRLVTNAEYLEFVEDGGYRRPEFWLSAGWQQMQDEGWRGPLYWIERDGRWWEFTLRGLRPLEPEEPVCHVSYFEADAFARWAGARLPTEAEWEVAAANLPIAGTFVEAGRYHPSVAEHGTSRDGLQQMFGDVWQWTSSGYAPYPGYAPPEGALGEYNGKFMCNQYVLRGGSCATPKMHVRRTYRNFFPPGARWQFAGMRLARSALDGASGS